MFRPSSKLVVISRDVYYLDVSHVAYRLDDCAMAGHEMPIIRKRIDSVGANYEAQKLGESHGRVLGIISSIREGCLGSSCMF
jgi:hypothetical protein